MSGIATAVEELVLSTIISEKILMPHKSRADWGLTVLAVLLAGAGVFFLGLSLDRYLETIYDPARAALASGILVLGASVIAGAMAWNMRNKKAVNLGAAKLELSKNIRFIIESLAEELDEPVRDSPKTAMAIAAATGFFAANSHFK